MIIRLPLSFAGSKNKKSLDALFDTGATYSCINNALVKDMGKLTPLRKPLYLPVADNAPGEITHAIVLDFYYQGIRMSDEFLVVAALGEEVIIGAATIRKWGLKLDFEHQQILTDPRIAKPILINLIENN